ncbi:hypothetical protein ASPZODRAFT_20187 [Penicilliopsis zonata CBS 506.65]|uniref:Uncharacterized protein n=1 Tax=Penicilliopsis zonata CBS 506.65 TaxID=1073090 RepID=A0A1L9S675_9EURO|nr:hypothetical protein ASPZODRAFT_20187 [Penicilliopsis zonata CBS 506.65]OJJ42660.1 hypothetical protein ASPZODRAFT_20187 [Penicilliopsis zonata CBS 506.65]
MRPLTTAAYEKLGLMAPSRSRSTSPEPYGAERPRRRDTSCGWRRWVPGRLVVLILVPLATFIALLVIGALLLRRTWNPLLSQITITANIPPDFCGHTPAEAKAAGCAFEMNNFAWMHPDCYDQEQSERAL